MSSFCEVVLAAELSGTLLAGGHLPAEFQLELAGVGSSSCQLLLLLYVDVTLHPISREVDFGSCPAFGVHPNPNSLGERWSISLRASALSSSKASRVLLGREDLAARASTPLSLKSWMASRTVCGPQPRLWAIFGAYSPLELARSAWHRRMVKVFFERSPAWRASRSSSENERTKIGVFMDLTVTRNTKPILKLH